MHYNYAITILATIQVLKIQSAFGHVSIRELLEVCTRHDYKEVKDNLQIDEPYFTGYATLRDVIYALGVDVRKVILLYM